MTIENVLHQTYTNLKQKRLLLGLIIFPMVYFLTRPENKNNKKKAKPTNLASFMQRRLGKVLQTLRDCVVFVDLNPLSQF